MQRRNKVVNILVRMVLIMAGLAPAAMIIAQAYDTGSGGNPTNQTTVPPVVPECTVAQEAP